jgi:hypothetical protein
MKTFVLPFFLGIAISMAGCSMFPDRLIYPNDMKTVKPKKETVTVKAEPAEGEGIEVVGDEQAGEEASPGEEVVFGSAAKPAEVVGKEDEAPDYANYSEKEGKILTQRERKRLSKVKAHKSGKGYNALTKTFPIGYDQLWDDAVETMLFLPLKTIDKSSGIIVSDWTMNRDISSAAMAASNIFGDGIRIIRYKYTVRIYDRGDSAEITVIPFAQVSKSRRWHEAKPAMAITEKLMRKIIRKVEE